MGTVCSSDKAVPADAPQAQAQPKSEAPKVDEDQVQKQEIVNEAQDVEENNPLFFPNLEVPVTGAQYVGGMPKFTADHKSLMAKTLTQEMFDKYKGTKSEMGVTLEQCIKTGVDTPHLGVGCTAGDESCYETYKDLFYPVIEGWHKFKVGVDKHQTDLDHTKIVMSDEQKATFNDYVKSTRIRAARCLKGHLLPSSATSEDRAAVEGKLVDIFANSFTGELAGTYYKLGDVTKNAEQTEFLRSNGFLFQMPKKRNLLYFSGAANEWPDSRGIFHNESHTFLAWVNEEDHCRIISMSKDGDVADVFQRFCKASKAMEENAECMRSDDLGYIGTCPSNLGTGLRASVMVVLKVFNENVELLEKACASLDLQPRGSAGEHSDAVGAKWDVSNKQRIGFSEVQLVQKMIDGVTKLIAWEKRMANGELEAVKAEIEALGA